MHLKTRFSRTTKLIDITSDLVLKIRVNIHFYRYVKTFKYWAIAYNIEVTKEKCYTATSSAPYIKIVSFLNSLLKLGNSHYKHQSNGINSKGTNQNAQPLFRKKYSDIGSTGNRTGTSLSSAHIADCWATEVVGKLMIKVIYNFV